MNSRGLYIFITVTSMAILIAVLVSSSMAENAKAMEQKPLLFEAEKANFMRAVIEENADYIAEKKLEEAISKGMGEGEARKEVGKALFSYFMEMEKPNHENPRIEFFYGKRKLEQQDLENNSKVLIIDTRQGITLAEYYIVYGQGKEITAGIETAHFRQEFLLPHGYTTRVGVAR